MCRPPSTMSLRRGGSFLLLERPGLLFFERLTHVGGLRTDRHFARIAAQRDFIDGEQAHMDESRLDIAERG